ncbi:TraB/GumN family protein [Aurantiacibacter poecillastricola]|uniref:TraB/GumN family protein n=1 Tax=Aurantiacibacter poecillastricola TaxID=3064385 RepID=UPI00274011BC|nr:TraB/GumN family protein [Aurantiacibacter sp. 219JJ12-13]MDP5262053.1 TraB/GumN family protein [Aurantiacibacter sp. 219JJ12-13]
MKPRRFWNAFFALFLAAIAMPAAAQDDDRFAFTQDYEPAPALWSLSDEDTTIYMLGTIHLLPEGFRWRNPQLDAIIDEVDELVVETSDAENARAMERIEPKLAKLVERRATTSSQLSPQARPRWRQLVRMSGIPFETADNMPVLIALLGLAQPGIEGDPSSYEYGVETVLELEFAESGRPIGSIEDSGHVMYGLSRVNDVEVIEELDSRLQEWDGKSGALYESEYAGKRGDAYWAMEHSWAQGEVADDFDFNFGGGKIGEAFSHVLLDHRNTRWAEWLDKRLDEPGSILLAVGAGHFEGPHSLLLKLQDRGLEAERIN